MVSLLCACNNFAGIDERQYTICYSGLRHADVNVFLAPASGIKRKPKKLVNAVHLRAVRTHSKGAIIADVGR
jgi:hypothetical protein